MSWQTPKTNWSSYIDSDGNYVGDRFNASDFNRIKNNLVYLHELATQLYREFDINDIGGDRTPADFFYADEINKLEDNLKSINANTVKRNYGTAPTYKDNGKTMDFKELNRLESATLDIYNRLTNQYENRRTFKWNFGIKGDLNYGLD